MHACGSGSVLLQQQQQQQHPSCEPRQPHAAARVLTHAGVAAAARTRTPCPCPDPTPAPAHARTPPPPTRLLGLSKDASFEEVQDARNFLFEQYRWHEPSRESIELAFEAILKVGASVWCWALGCEVHPVGCFALTLTAHPSSPAPHRHEPAHQDTFKARTKFGFRPPRTGRGTDARGEPAPWTLERRFRNLFDPTISTTAMINEGAVYVGLALWWVGCAYV